MSTLQPILALLHLTSLSIDAAFPCNNPDSESIALVELDDIKCKLTRLQLIGSADLQRRLADRQPSAFERIAAGVTNLSIMEAHHPRFADQLSRLSHVTSLELTSTLQSLPTNGCYRQRLLAALRQMLQLTHLRLQVYIRPHGSEWDLVSPQPDEDFCEYHESEDFETDSQNLNIESESDDEGFDFERWSSTNLTELLKLPLRSLAVQHLEPSAGQALATLVNTPNRSLRSLKLGVTDVDWQNVAAVASQLDILQLHASNKPRPVKRGAKNRSKRSKPVQVTVPPNVTFYEQWK